jgi:hypothetical protein
MTDCLLSALEGSAASIRLGCNVHGGFRELAWIDEIRETPGAITRATNARILLITG